MAALQAVLKWHPRPPFFYGWLVLGTAATGAFVATSVAGAVLGGIQGFIFEETGWNRSTIGLAAALGVWGSGLLGPVVGRLVDRHNARWLMAAGTITLGVCLFSLGASKSVWVFYAAAIVGRAVSQPLLIGVVPRTLAVNFFQRKRNLALALTGMFRPVSAAIIIQLISALALVFDWRTAFRYFGILSLFLTLPVVLLIRRRPEEIGLLPDGARPGNRPVSSEAGAVTPAAGANPVHLWTAHDALHTKAFWLIALTTLLGVTSSSAIGFSMVPYLHEEAHISRTEAVGVLSLSTFLSLANLAWGYLADKLTPRWCLVGSMVAAAAMILYLFSIDSLAAAYIFGVLWGTASAAQEVLTYMLLADYFGRASYGTIAGSLRPLEAGGLGLGQILGPTVYDLTGSYNGLFLSLFGVYLAAALLVFLARRPVAPTVGGGGPTGSTV